MGRCVVLMYHVVDTPRSAGEARFCCDPSMFAAQMQHLADEGWHVIPLADLVSTLRAGKEPKERSVVITFDDGTACTHENALPVLARHGFPASVFVVSGLVGTHNQWMSGEGYPKRRMLDAAQLRELVASDIDVGSHTASHVRLAKIPLPVAVEEIRRSRSELEGVLGNPVRYFAYPYGNFNPQVRDAVQDAGYEGACSTRWGRNDVGVDPFAIKRVEVMGADRLWQFRLKLRSGTNDMPPWSVPRAAVKRTLQGLGVMSGAPKP